MRKYIYIIFFNTGFVIGKNGEPTSYDIIDVILNFFKRLQELVLKRCKFPQYRLAKFSMTPYLQNTVKRLTLSECEIDNPHFEDFVTIFPNLEELEIYQRDYYEYNSFMIESLMDDLKKLCGLKNLRIVKINNLYGADEDG